VILLHHGGQIVEHRYWFGRLGIVSSLEKVKRDATGMCGPLQEGLVAPGETKWNGSCYLPHL